MIDTIDILPRSHEKGADLLVRPSSPLYLPSSVFRQNMMLVK
ncbi:hypothetical protein ACRAWD_30820 [Caulobacter segnis]